MTAATETAISFPRVIARPFVWLALFLLAIVATQSPITSVVLLGFVYARMHRRITGDAIDGVWAKIKLGIAGTLTLASLTLIPGILWTFSWHAGWDNSFNKGYEQASIGPLTGLLGVAIFLVIMPYVQIAQSQHVATGDWRAFYRIRENMKLWSGAPLSAALLPILYALAGLPIFLLFALPAFPPQMTSYVDTTDAEVLGRLRAWYFLGGALFVVLLFGIKRGETFRCRSLRRHQRRDCGRCSLHQEETRADTRVPTSGRAETDGRAFPTCPRTKSRRFRW